MKKLTKKDIKECLSISLPAVIFSYIPAISIENLDYQHTFQLTFFFLAANLLNLKKTIISVIIYFVVFMLIPDNLIISSGKNNFFTIKEHILIMLIFIPSAMVICFLSQKTEEYKFINIFAFNSIGIIIILLFYKIIVTFFSYESLYDFGYNLPILLIINAIIASTLARYLYSHYEVGDIANFDDDI